MRKDIKRVLLMALMVVVTAGMLAGCGPKKPTAEDAQAYVKAVLDLMCTGDYDHSVKLVDVEEGTGVELREALVEETLGDIGAESNISDELIEGFKNFMLDALTKANYTVGDAVETEDGGYDVTVSIAPLQLFTGIEEELMGVLEERVAAEPDKILAMSEEEQNNYIMEILLELLNKKIADPQYDPPEDVVVHYGLMEGEDNVYGCDDAEGEKLGAKLFSQSGL